ncbi:hypothetical protein AN5380.2 [Aspergillus nidulans FGSC A4]|uniref:Fumarylacetoacetate hydrolase family protein (AFU_orthologue AFUA_7G07000) n=1 Tax=Emericella nidulans (strain FGSC A4 / ATCC 38163 / CBS 112.46 / NRRL 194 / M139) TaxID=227321 RepID=Q5B250_EMENI|nr:hypothetical protein [Aspergillus nidulans FGSC A4]EAA62540.1 hypothetical protein AN5380.2 [Aspergillus nidulans FGSC A4]CBF82005.1 TPA: fumarylacetoacetate hydrolase family protein (AFU_orthologue; AFUA_7G07000) [Aspergillus nidulans FGSC A4]|eukprot:XP_662984.1 hypothetical protein AN5380.2 [Aspergillus nidulans FGSC A4]
MATFEYLFHFGTEEGEEYFTKCNSTNPDIGTLVNSFFTLEDLLGDKNPKQATVAKLNIHSNPPLWTKPSAHYQHQTKRSSESLYSLLHAGFETSHLKIYILGYTTGNDPSCRFFQLPEQSGGQFFYAKAFDKFAPIGPVLASPHIYNAAKATATLITRINREVKKNTLIRDDMVFSAERMLSWMSQTCLTSNTRLNV